MGEETLKNIGNVHFLYYHVSPYFSVNGSINYVKLIISRNKLLLVLRAASHKYRPKSIFGGTSQKIDFAHILFIGRP